MFTNPFARSTSSPSNPITPPDFPTTGILDDFNRANDPDITGFLNWIADPFSLPAFGLTSNQLLNISGYGANLWNDSFVNAEAYITITDGPDASGTNEIAVGARYNGQNGYFVYWQNNGGSQTIGIWKHVSGTGSQIGTDTSVTLANGDKIGISVIGTTITAHKFTGGVWSIIQDQTDSTHSSGGDLWLFSKRDNSDIALDDFGGGEVA